MREWLEPLLSADEMRAIDRWAIEDQGVPGIQLMERAGSAVAEAAKRIGTTGPISIVCGKGNNGGDGLVAARQLIDTHRVSVLLLCDMEALRGDAKINLDRYLAAGGEIFTTTADTEVETRLAGSELVIDAIVGTGFRGQPEGVVAAAIAATNSCGAKVVSVDIPSGIDASSGEVPGDAVAANCTVTFHQSKVGQWIRPAKSLVGELEVAEIGIPSGAQEATGGAAAGLITADVLEQYPVRTASSSKFTSGSLAVLGGSTGLTGAVCMAAEAAMRTGAGYVKVLVPQSLNLVFEEKLTEVMTVPVADSDGCHSLGSKDQIVEAAASTDAVVLGPGLGRSEDTQQLVRELSLELTCPTLVDADGLNAFAGVIEPGELAGSVLTPHQGELARLLGLDADQIGARRLASAKELAKRSGAVVVLKGDDTIVCQSEQIAISGQSTPGLATAGSGDVLSGVIGALLAKGLPPFTAASLGVYVHSQAGIYAAKRIGADGMIASDVIEALPQILS